MTAPTAPKAPTYDLFLAFCPATTLAATELPSIALDGASRVVSVDLYYRAETDVALIGVRIDAGVMTQSFLTQLRHEAAAAGASVLEPARLGPPDRTRFYSEHLAQYKLKVLGFPTVADAARKLSTDLGARGRPVASGPSPRVKIRWRAGDRWQLARARNLTREGFYVYASAPPRVGDTVSVALSAGEHNLTLKAQVVHVTPDDAAVTVGGPGFGGRFATERLEDRSTLEKIVIAGRGEGLGQLRAAPSRREARFAARWPVAIGGQPAAPALDLSWHGLFVASPDTSHAGRIDVRIAAHDGGVPLRAHARVARVVTPADARARGIISGLGLELEAFASGDAARYEKLVTRVGERSRRRLLIGASTARLAAVADPLTAAGYVVSGVSVPGDLEAQITGTKPDLVVIDAGFSAPPRYGQSCTLERGRDSAILVTVDGAALAKATT